MLSALETAAAETVYMGDSGTDIEFAHRAGMIAAAAPWGYRSIEELAGQAPDLLPAVPTDLLKMLDKRIF